MNEETKQTIEGLVWTGIIVGGFVGATYLSWKIFAGMTAKAVAKELVKKGVILAATAAI